MNIAINELIRRPKRYLLNITIIAAIVVLIVTTYSLSKAYKETARMPFNNIGTDIIIQRNGNVPINVSGTVLSCSMAPVPSGLIPILKNINGVKEVSYGLSLWVFDGEFKRVFGTNWDDQFGRTIQSKLMDGQIPQLDEALLEKNFAEKSGLDIGDYIDIDRKSFRISGIVQIPADMIGYADAYISLGSAQEIAFSSENLQTAQAFEKDDLNLIMLSAEQVSLSDVEKELKTVFTEGSDKKTPLGNSLGAFNIYTPKSFERNISQLFNISDKIIIFSAFVIILISALVFFRQATSSIENRKRDFIVLRAAGFSDRSIMKILAEETIIQILLGYICGIFISVVIVFMLSQYSITLTMPWEINGYPHFLLSDPSQAQMEADYKLPIRISISSALMPFAILAIIALISMVISYFYLKKINNMEVLRYD